MAEHGLNEIQHLYKIDHLCNEANLSFEERKTKRLELSKPIMEAMKLWLETEGVKYSESSQIDRQGYHLCLYSVGQHDEILGGRKAVA